MVINRALLAWLFCIVPLVQAIAADVKPADGGGPVFLIFAAGSSSGTGAPTIDLSNKKPLMVVATAADVRLSKDRRAIRFTLNRNDARRFAGLTRKHAREFLVLQGGGKVLEAMQVSSPVTNGVLEFTYPDDAAVADYLKKRFGLK
ncbi:MAG TPA: hypothetical protein VJ719_12405 [Chthoniobacterales bacterium]|nr:hypothetical protein [Chthoniobacterales bacterium]